MDVQLRRQVLRASPHTPAGNRAANDVSAVIHHRVHRLAARSLRKTGQYAAQIVGLVTPAIHTNNPVLLGPLRELESQIVERANSLSDDLLTNPPAWYGELRRVASMTPDQELHELARVVAAYRECHQIHGDSILGDVPPAKATEQHRQRSRLIKVLAGFSSLTPEQEAHEAGVENVRTQPVSRLPD